MKLNELFKIQKGLLKIDKICNLLGSIISNFRLEYVVFLMKYNMCIYIYIVPISCTAGSFVFETAADGIDKHITSNILY